jgi:trimethyllysine dioxygenase
MQRYLSPKTSLFKRLNSLKTVLENTPTKIKLQWSSGTTSTFLPIWLRDHCRCNQCIHPKSLGRSVDNYGILAKMDKLKLKSLHDKEGVLSIEWDQESVIHQSTYPIDFLKMYSQENLPKKFDTPTSKTTHLWNHTLKDLPILDYNEINANDAGLLKWMETLERYGFSLMKNVPIDKDAPHKGTRDIMEKISYTRKSVFGDFWEFSDDGHMDDSAYTNEHLNIHLDGTYAQDPPGLQFFHCIEGNYVGGMSFLVDGFWVSEQLRKTDPKAFEFFTTTRLPFQWKSGGSEIFFKNRARIITTDEDGEVTQFRYNDIDRGVLDIHPKDHELYYKSFYSLLKILQSPEAEITFKLEPGTLMTTNGWRVLHGRTNFKGRRKIIGAYINQEDFLSKLRVLRGKKE